MTVTDHDGVADEPDVAGPDLATVMPRVLVDLSVAAAGGAATYSRGFAQGLIDSDDADKTDVVALVDAAWAEDNADLVSAMRRAGVTVVAETFPPPGSWRARLSRGRVVARVVRDHGVDVAFFPRDAAPLLSVPTVVLLNNRYAWASFASGQAIGGWLPAHLLRVVAYLTSRRAASVLAVSETMAAAARSARVDAVVHHGCSLPEYPRSGDAVATSPNRPVQVLMVGNLIENKRVEVVLEGLAAVRRKGGSWDLRVHGTRMDETYADQVEALSWRLLGESVIKPPMAAGEMVDAYRWADVLVMGGAFESFCHPLVEGMRSGCVVVAPDTDLVREICGDAAVLYREGDAEDLARALEVAERERVDRSQAGIERSRRFRWADTVDQTLRAVRDAARDEHRGSVVDRVALRLWRPSRFGPSVGVDERDRARIMVGLSVAPPGGAATYVSGFCRGLIDGDIPHKDQIVVVIDSRWAEVNTDLVEEMQAAGVVVSARTFPAPGTWKARLGRGRILAQVAREMGVRAAFIPREVAPSLGVPTVVLARNMYAWVPLGDGGPIGGRVPAFLLRRAAWLSAARASAVLAVSHNIARHVRPRAVGTVVHHGCQLAEFERPTREESGAPVVVTVGNLLENKGFENVIGGVAEARTLADVGWRLSIYGNRTDPAYASMLEDLSVELLGESVLRGPAYGEDLESAYRSADVVVVGTTFESFCHPLVEAMRCGAVVVAPEGALVREICGDVAVTYTEGDAGSLGRALVTAVAESEDRSARGRERSRRFSWPRAAEQTVGAVRSVAAATHTSVAGR